MAEALLTRPALEVRGQHLGSTMQMLGWVGRRDTGNLRRSSSGSPSFVSLAEFKAQWVAGRDSLTHMACISCLLLGPRATVVGAPGDAGVGAMGRALRCTNSQDDTRHRSMSFALAKHSTHWLRATSGRSAAGGPGPSPAGGQWRHFLEAGVTSRQPGRGHCGIQCCAALSMY